MQITKEFTFHAAHNDEEATDACGRLHGHSYLLEITVSGWYRRGDRMLLHGDVLKEVYRRHLEPLLDHHYLNESLGFNPTMERVAVWCQQTFYEHLTKDPRVTQALKVSVVLWETPTMKATYP